MRRKRIVPSKLTVMARDPALMVRLCTKAKVSAEGCWEWQGHKDDKGYGQFRVGPRAHWAHRVAYALFNGPIPEGMTVHHKKECLNPSCVNPDHLELMTNGDNVREGNERRRRQLADEDFGDIPV